MNEKQVTSDRRQEAFKRTAAFSYFLLLVTCHLLFSSPAHAIFSDEVGVTFEEAFKAAKQVVEVQASGIRSLDDEKYEVVSNWKYDTVQRRRGLLRNFIKKEYHRRYRLKVTITKGEAATMINVKVFSQEKSRNISPAAPWKDSRGDRSELRIERRIFEAILAQLAKNKSQPPASEIKV